jgi:hypothetical protein
VFKRRGSIKLGSGVRLNYGKHGITSANIGGVRIGTGRRSGSSRPTKTQLLAQQWRLKPGMHFIRILLDAQSWIDLVVDGGELTFRRLDRINDGLYDGDTAAVARAFKAFVKSWDILGNDGKPLPISKDSVDQLGVEMIFGLAVEAANALQIPAKPLGNVLKERETGNPVRVMVSDRPFPSSVLPVAPSIMARAAAPEAVKPKSTGLAYLVWLLLGLVGGHRYYLGRPKTAFLMTITFGGVGLWWLIDAFLIPGMIRQRNLSSG